MIQMHMIFAATENERTVNNLKVTLDIPDDIVCGFFNGVQITYSGMQLVSYQLGSDDLKDGNIVKLPRERKEGDE